MQWSPSSSTILIATENDLHVFDEIGEVLARVLSDHVGMPKGSRIIGMEWREMFQVNKPCLAIATDTGFVYILRNEYDRDPVIIETGLANIKLKWNPVDSILVVAGNPKQSKKRKESTEGMSLHFYTPFGEVIIQIESC